jgi:ectoine hydroxylase-related dioxygenase (phytanoyl-CoA dioxygenase family)
MAELASAYDREMLRADPADRGIGGSSTRVHDFVNRGEEFDQLYLHTPVLGACCLIIEQPFKLSTMHARTVRPRTGPQKLHVDFQKGEDGWPMLGFILMVDEFRPENGATCFAPGSQGTAVMPLSNSLVPACGPVGSMIVFNGSVWHGHGANETGQPRRSIQGAYIRRTEESRINLPGRMRTETLNRIGSLAKYLLAL